MEKKYAVNNFMTGSVMLVDTKEEAISLFWENVTNFIKVRYGNIMFYELEKTGDDYTSTSNISLPNVNLTTEQIAALYNNIEIPTSFTTAVVGSSLDSSLTLDN